MRILLAYASRTPWPTRRIGGSAAACRAAAQLGVPAVGLFDQQCESCYGTRTNAFLLYREVYLLEYDAEAS